MESPEEFAHEVITENSGAVEPVMTSGTVEVASSEAEEKAESRPLSPSSVTDGDTRESARRKRVDSILNSKTFKTELERLIDCGLLNDGDSGALDQLVGMMAATRGSTHNNNTTGAAANGFVKGQHSVLPIADLRGAEAAQYSHDEKSLRCKLASLFRAVDVLGWSDNVRNNHFVARISDNNNMDGGGEFLTNPASLLYGEISATSLLRVTLPATASGCSLDVRQLTRVHCAVLRWRPRANCVLFVQAPAAVLAVSGVRGGLAPALSEHAAVLGVVPVVRQPLPDAGLYDSLLAVDAAGDGETDECGVLMVQNCGAVCYGRTVEQTFFMITKLVAACDAQVKAMSLGWLQGSDTDDDERLLCTLTADQCRQFYESARQAATNTTAVNGSDMQQEAVDWRLGELQFEAMMRLLDAAGHRTAHAYRLPVPGCGAATAGGPHDPTPDDQYLYSPRRMTSGARAGERNRWLSVGQNNTATTATTTTTATALTRASQQPQREHVKV